MPCGMTELVSALGLAHVTANRHVIGPPVTRVGLPIYMKNEQQASVAEQVRNVSQPFTVEMHTWQ